MKKLAYVLLTPIFIMILSCGGGAESSDSESTEDSSATQMTGMTELDLSQYGMNLSIMVPDETVGQPVVQENEMGGVDIIVGQNFSISVLYGMGDIALVKSDLNDDLVYESTILSDEADMIIYEKSIPESGMEPEYHFYRTIELDGQVYDIQNTMNQTFGKASIERMAESAKTLRANSSAS